jgi:hypothetical protein
MTPSQRLRIQIASTQTDAMLDAKEWRVRGRRARIWSLTYRSAEGGGLLARSGNFREFCATVHEAIEIFQDARREQQMRYAA